MGIRCTRRQVVAAAAAALLAMAAAVAYQVRDPSPVGYWRSAEASDGYRAAYAEAMAQMPTPTETFDVRTSFGVVRAYRFASADPASHHTPVVLLPGRGSGSPMWSTNIRGLLGTHTVYTLDALGDAGLSIQERPIASLEDQAAWLDEVFTALKLSRVNLVGHSFGGWNAANYALRHPGRIATLALIEPIEVLCGMRWQIYALALPATLPAVPQSWRNAALAKIGGGAPGDVRGPVAEMISAGTQGYVTKLPLPQRISDAQLRTLTMPVYVALGQDSAINTPDEALRTAQATISHLTARVWPGGTHSLPMQFADTIDGELASFFAP